MKHTKAPWHVSYSDKHGTYYIEGSRGNDTNLIAAAPNMYNLLEMIYKENQVDPEVKKMIKRVLQQGRGVT